MLGQNLDYLLLGIATACHVLGFIAAPRALVKARTSQGAIAWALSLITFPYLAVPLYLLIGRSRFVGYVRARRMRNAEFRDIYSQVVPHLLPNRADLSGHPDYKVFEDLAEFPFSRYNASKLLVDGEAAFAEVFRMIDGATAYILVQFFIVRDDPLGRELADRLLKKAAEGVRVYFLFDGIGSVRLPGAFIRRLREGGVEIRGFRNSQGRWVNRYQLNFRNHRKVVIADGNEAWLGGLNVGDEYRSRGSRFAHWRDTAVLHRGPCVDGLQLTWVEDWFWATGTVPELDWEAPSVAEQDHEVLVFPSGPADPLETCNLMFLHAIQSAEERIWIASPYFVPDREVIAALQLAALRGVDVRILLPNEPDHKMVYWASFACLAELGVPGLKIYRYRSGFMHQKAMLMDRKLSFVGTANLDNRSFRLNFEITTLIHDEVFAAEVASMFEADFAESRVAPANEIDQRGVGFHLLCRIARLFSPVL